MAQGVPYTPTQSDTDGKTVKEVVADSATDYGIGTEFTAVSTSLSALPAIYSAATLSLQGGIDFNQFGITKLASINASTFFVDGYGADPTGASDSRVAVIACIQAAVDAGGGTVVFSAGTYTFGQAMALNTDTTGTNTPLVFVGAGQRLTTLKITGSGGAVFDLTSWPDVEFHKLKFTTDSACSSATTFVKTLRDDTQFYDCIFTGGHATAAAVLSMSTTTTNTDFMMVRCTIDGQYTGDPVSLYRTRNARLIDVSFNLTTGTADSCIYVRTTGGADNDDVSIINPRINMTAGSAARACILVEAAHTTPVTVVNPTITTSLAVPAIQCAATAENLHITGGRIFFNNDSNVSAVSLIGDYCSATGVTIIGNDVADDGTGCEAQGIDVGTADYGCISGCNIHFFKGGVTGDAFAGVGSTSSVILGNNCIKNAAVTITNSFDGDGATNQNLT